MLNAEISGNSIIDVNTCIQSEIGETKTVIDETVVEIEAYNEMRITSRVEIQKDEKMMQ